MSALINGGVFSQRVYAGGPAQPRADELRAALKAANPDYRGGGNFDVEDGRIVRVNIQAQRIRDLSPLRGLPLRALDCGMNDVTDLSPLSGMPLHVLLCDANGVEDLSSLKGMRLIGLECSRNEIADLSPLRGMALKILGCGHNKIADLSPLKWVPLVALHCEGNRIRDLSPLAGMPLERLLCSKNLISDLASLKGIPLEELDCGQTQVCDLSPLKGSRLRVLGAYDLEIRDLSVLLDVPLSSLALSPGKVKGGRVAFSRHETLKDVYVNTPYPWGGSGRAFQMDIPLIGRGMRPIPVRAEVFLADLAMCSGEPRLVATLLGHTGRVHSVGFSPDGKQIESAAADGTVRLWDAATCQCMREGKGRRAPVPATLVSPDRKLRISGSEDGSITLADAASGKPLAVLLGHKGAVACVALSLDGFRLVSGGADGTVRVWSLGRPDPIELRKLGEIQQRAIAAAMKKTVTFDFAETPLEDVMNFLSSLADISIVLDPRAAKDAPKITLRANEMPLGDALKRICNPLGLFSVVLDDALFVGRERDVKDMQRHADAMRQLQGQPDNQVAAKFAKTVTFDFVETPLQDVTNVFSSLIDVTIIVDLQGAGDVPNITLRANDMRFEQSLRWVCRRTGLDYTWLDGALFLASPARMKASLGEHEALRAATRPPTKELAETLAKKITFDFVETPLPDVVAFLAELTKLPLLVDDGLEENPPTVTLRVGDMPADSAIRWCCRVGGLACVWRGEKLIITTPERAREEAAKRKER